MRLNPIRGCEIRSTSASLVLQMLNMSSIFYPCFVLILPLYLRQHVLTRKSFNHHRTLPIYINAPHCDLRLHKKNIQLAVTNSSQCGVNKWLIFFNNSFAFPKINHKINNSFFLDLLSLYLVQTICFCHRQTLNMFLEVGCSLKQRRLTVNVEVKLSQYIYIICRELRFNPFNIGLNCFLPEWLKRADRLRFAV